MSTNLDLEELGKRLATVDTMIMVLAAKRMELALHVGRHKRETGEKIFRADIEDRRIERVRAWAKDHGVNPHFAESLLYLLINESCKQQMILLQSEQTGDEPDDEDERYRLLKNNLLELTAAWAHTYDEQYDSEFFATHAYCEYERDIVMREVRKLARRERAIDLGCATGESTFNLGTIFEHVIGFDISLEMIDVATQKKTDATQHVIFECVDLEEGIPCESASVDFVLMNMGTASDVRNINHVLSEVFRVLRPGGRFVLSFYNRDALVYRWELLPWPTGLAAQINVLKNCLDVHGAGGVRSVYAHAYKLGEVQELLADYPNEVNLVTYPTISAILPHDVFTGQPEMQRAVGAIDDSLSTAGEGAYIIASGVKT